MTQANPFQGFSSEAITFLRDLRDHNQRAWFNDHKSIYEREIKGPAQAFSEAMAETLEELTGAPHDYKIFRIHRDVRFSKDKTPYNTHLHIAFVPKLGISAPPSWFFGLDPDSLTLGAGIFAFDKADLERFRRRVLGTDGADLAVIANDLQSQGVRLGEPHLKRVPSGLPKEHPRADLLRYKGFSAWIDHPDAASATDPALIARCRRDFERLKPIVDWLEKD